MALEMNNINSHKYYPPQNLENHISITSSGFIKQICSELTKIYGITYFSFHRDFKDGSRIWLCSNPDWTLHLYQVDYCTINSFNTKKITNKNHVYFPWDSMINLLDSENIRLSYIERLHDAKNDFNINKGFTIIEYSDFYKDFFSFATTTTNSNAIIDIYFNNLDVLLAFTIYFKDIAAPLIRQAMRKRISINKSQTKIPPSLLTASCNHRFITYNNQSYLLTSREEECLALLSCGKIAKEIATILHLSNRTVENYINVVKEKLNCHHKTELINIYFKNNQTITP